MFTLSLHLVEFIRVAQSCPPPHFLTPSSHANLPPCKSTLNLWFWLEGYFHCCFLNCHGFFWVVLKVQQNAKMPPTFFFPILPFSFPTCPEVGGHWENFHQQKTGPPKIGLADYSQVWGCSFQFLFRHQRKYVLHMFFCIFGSFHTLEFCCFFAVLYFFLNKKIIPGLARIQSPAFTPCQGLHSNAILG